MTGIRRVFMAAFLLLGSMISAHAVTPDEMLDDPVLEERARDISANLRCLVCQNQSIDDSNAELARDLRLLVRERLVDGDTNAEVVDYIVSRYGEFVLLKPRFSVRTLALWFMPLVILVLGASILVLGARNRAKAQAESTLSPKEEADIARLVEGRQDDR